MESLGSLNTERRSDQIKFPGSSSSDHFEGSTAWIDAPAQRTPPRGAYRTLPLGLQTCARHRTV